MSHVYEAKITALEGECERLRAANAQLTEERDELKVEMEAWMDRGPATAEELLNLGDKIDRLEARVKRYRDALVSVDRELMQRARGLGQAGAWCSAVRELHTIPALAEPKADSEGA